MKKTVFALFSAMAVVATTQADVPVFRDQELTLKGAVVVTQNGPRYYGDVRMDAHPNGTLTLAYAERRNLAMVDDVEVIVLESQPVQVIVEVTGNLSVPCVDLEEPGVMREGNTFTIVLAETPLDPLALCAMQIVEYEISIPLDVRGLDAGVYTVFVNGEEATFTLDNDNT